MKKILILEDNIGIARSIQLELEKSGYKAFPADAIQKADDILENQTIDLMIIGFELLSDANSCDWIQSRNSKKLLTPPFVVSTEQLNEKIALEIKKMGASDYLLKGSMLISCMNHVVNRVLKEIEQKEKITSSQRALEESEKRYRMLFEKNPEPMLIVSKDFRFLEVNDAALKHYGYSRKEFLSLTIADIKPQEDIESMYESVSRAFNTKKLTKAISRHVKKNGELMITEVTPSFIEWQGQIASHVLVNDITEKPGHKKCCNKKEFDSARSWKKVPLYSSSNRKNRFC